MSIQMVLVSSPAKPVLRSLLHQGTCCFRLCKLVGEISVHAPVRVPRFSPNCAHSRLRRSRASPSPNPPPLATATPCRAALPGTLGLMRAYFLVKGCACHRLTVPELDAPHSPPPR